MQDTLLIELFTEELPPKSLATVAKAFHYGIAKGLADHGFIKPELLDKPVNLLATPRRLAVVIPNTLKIQPDQIIERKGPYVSSGLDQNGKPTPALLGFSKSCGVDVEALKKAVDNKGEYYVFKSKKRGEALNKYLVDIVQQTLKKLPIAKLMHWGDKDVEFVRPVHGLIMMHGNKVIQGEVLGLKSAKKTLGHRFLSNKPITITHADDYLSLLEKKGYVIADLNKRKNKIAKQLQSVAIRYKANLVEHEDLLDEVTALVEYPVIYTGQFDQSFLNVPQECLILSMKQHQKYFPLVDKKDKLLAKFLIVSNMKTAKSKNIVHGNERVIRARLSDAKFFYEQDQKIKLADRVPQLENVVYHNKLGSQYKRVERIQAIAKSIAQKLKVDQTLVERAAYLCKADLLTNMVGEFPELQGTMGQYYARHDKENEEVAVAIEAHYHPRSAYDSLPQNDVGTCVALAEKLDTLVGIYGIGLVPTGDKDPFGLRRQALAIIRILIEKDLSLSLGEDLLSLALAAFNHPKEGQLYEDILKFVRDRLRNYLRDREFEPDEIESVVEHTLKLDEISPRLNAVQAFKKIPEGKTLAAAHKRIRNILKSAKDIPQAGPSLDRMQESEEKALFQAMQGVPNHCARGQEIHLLKQLAQLGPKVDAFFDKVMVMDKDEDQKNNRLALLRQLEGLMNQVVDISKLAG